MSEKKKRQRNTTRTPIVKKRTADYVAGVLEGKSKYQSAKDAGFAESTARRTNCIESSAGAQAIFRALINEHIEAMEMVKLLREGMYAIDSKGDIDFDQRGKYLDRAAKWGGRYVEKQQIETKEKELHERSDEELDYYFAHGKWPEDK